MKSSIFLSAILLLLTLNAAAQKPETAQILVHYKFKHFRDTTDRAHPYTENTVLLVGKSAGAYKSYDAMLANEQNKKAYAAALASSPDGHVSIRRNSAGSPTEYYQFPNEQKLIIKDRLVMIIYLIEEPMPIIHWKISGDTASFAGLRCQKATGYFKGRDYTVWFCPQLPIRTGPWKLSGLPGVILDAHDAKNEVVFQFDSVEKTISSPPKSQTDNLPAQDRPALLPGSDDDPNSIAVPTGGIKSTQKEFDRLKEIMQKDPDAFAQLIMASQRGNMPGNGGRPDAMKIKVAPGPVINNPIELPEKK